VWTEINTHLKHILNLWQVQGAHPLRFFFEDCEITLFSLEELKTMRLVARPAHTRAFATISNMSPVEAVINLAFINSKKNDTRMKFYTR